MAKPHFNNQMQQADQVPSPQLRLHEPSLSPFNLLLLYSMIYQESWLAADGSETLTSDHELRGGHLKQ